MVDSLFSYMDDKVSDTGYWIIESPTYSLTHLTGM